MRAIALACYSIRIRQRNKKDAFLDCRNFDGKNNLKDFIDNLLTSWNTIVKNDESKQMFSVKTIDIDGKYTSGIIDTGEWGFESTLYDIDKNEVTHNRKNNEAEMLPFFYLYGFPEKKNKGFLLLERFGNLGIRKFLCDKISAEFRKKFPGLEIEFNAEIMEELAREYLENGRLIKIGFIKYDIPSDFADYVAEGASEEIAYSEYSIHAKRSGSIPFKDDIKKMFGKKTDLKRTLEIKSFEYDTVKMNLEINGQKRTLNIDDLANIRSYINIDNDVRKMENGHPEYASILEIAKNLYEELDRRSL
jgi:hypothetical protein